MADKSSYSDYQASGFSSAVGVEGLQSEKANIPTTDDALREQAVRQYQDTYDRLDESYAQQLSTLITSQATDEKLLNEQYNNSVSSMLAQLQKRGLHTTASLPGAQTAALNQHRNEVMAARSSLYSVQRKLPEAQRQLLHDNYDVEIRKRMAQNRATNVPQLSDLLGKLAELQSASFNDYINYLLAKKSKGGGGGGGYYRSSSSSSSSKSSSSSGGYVNSGTLKGTGSSSGSYIVHDMYVENQWRANERAAARSAKSTAKAQNDAVEAMWKRHS